MGGRLTRRPGARSSVTTASELAAGRHEAGVAALCVLSQGPRRAAQVAAGCRMGTFTRLPVFYPFAPRIPALFVAFCLNLRGCLPTINSPGNKGYEFLVMMSGLASGAEGYRFNSCRAYST